MPADARPRARPIRAVLFDFHATLVDQGDAAAWLAAAWTHDGRAGTPEGGLGAGEAGRLAAWADRVWEHARDVDPDGARDLDPAAHRAVFHTLAAAAGVDAPLTAALYATMLEQWVAYADAAPVLAGLQTCGVPVAVVSNVGIDIRTVLTREGLAELVDAVVLSYETQSVKPDPEIFSAALTELAVDPAETLMVGDNWRDDAGAAALGIRTLILPRTDGGAHGLDAVLRLVDR